MFAIGGSVMPSLTSNHAVTASIDELAIWPGAPTSVVPQLGGPGSVPVATGPYSGTEGMIYLNHFDDAKLSGSGPAIVECRSHETSVLVLPSTCGN